MKYTEEEQNLIILSSFSEIPHAARQSVLSALKSFAPDSAENNSYPIKSGADGVYNKVRANFYNAEYRQKVFEELEKRQVECVTLASEDYPELLKHIPDPPLTLFVKGRRELLRNRLFSIVGSRTTTVPALEQCKRFSKELSEQFTIVSGSAYGADSAALESANGRVISVLAFGFDSVGKVSNSQLIQKIAGAGLIISEYFPTVKPRTFYFPVRNRIIAGISKGTLIVSAGEKSGALITANCAAEYNREVFVFPYNIGVSSGEGCNALIKKGAALVQNPLDILLAFGLDLKPRTEKILSPQEQKVYSLIKDEGEVFVPVLAEKLGVQTFNLIPVLSLLEIKGLIVRLGGNRYSVI